MWWSRICFLNEENVALCIDQEKIFAFSLTLIIYSTRLLSSCFNPRPGLINRQDISPINAMPAAKSRATDQPNVSVNQAASVVERGLSHL
jgi:hypothetical protein